MADKWQCLFCKVWNESNTTTCSQCTKANTDVVNINRICLCGRKVAKYPKARSKCMSCFKVTEKKETTYYYCSAKQCTFRNIEGSSFAVCNACYESTNNSTIDSNHSFLFCKLVSFLDQIKKEAQSQNNDERRRYMFRVYDKLNSRYIAKLQNVMNESECKEIQRVFNAFYGGIMDEIKRDIDCTALGLSHDIFANKMNLKRKEWVKMNKISLKWHMLVEEHKEHSGSECVDVRCNDINKCGTRKRVQFVMGFYKDYFLKRFVYGEDSADDMQYIQIFQSALDGYTATDLLNDYLHTESYHGRDQEIMDCKYQNDDNDSARCCTMLWRRQREARHKRNVDRNDRINQSEVFSEYLKKLDETQRVVLEISSKIHSFVNHYTREPSNPTSLNSKATEPNYSKFVNEIEYEDESVEPDEKPMIRMDDALAQDLNNSGLSTKQCNHLMNELVGNEYDTDAIVADLTNENDPCNHYEQSQIYQSFLPNHGKYFVKIMRRR
eukprot:222853_1